MSTANVSILRNISGVTKYFDFLGEHGAELADGADIQIPGVIWARWANDAMKMAALMYAINNNLIELLQTPHVLGWDVSLTAPRRLAFASGGVSSANPDYGSYSGTSPSL